MIHISEESLNFCLLYGTSTFQTNQVLTGIENTQAGSQQINNHIKIFNNFENDLAMAKLKRPQHSLSHDLSKRSCFITII